MRKILTILAIMMVVSTLSFAATVKLDLAKQKKLDTFFSNFSETHVGSFDKGALTEQTMLEFALGHLYTNKFKSLKMSEDGNSATVTPQQVDTTTMKYFGQKIKQHSEKFYTIQCADGEAFCFSQLDTLDESGKKTFKATGTIYSTGSGGTPDVHGNPSDWEEAGEEVDVVGKFSAIIKFEGDRYILVEYKLANDDNTENELTAKNTSENLKGDWVKALAASESVTKLRIHCAEEEGVETEEGWTLLSASATAKHLPSALGSFTNLKELNINGLEALKELPAEIGNLTELESIIIDNGNGYSMNISLPESIGNLMKLKELNLYGAMDAPSFEGKDAELAKVKKLPQALEKLQNLEVLDLGRNRITKLPAQVASLSSLISLNLNYSAISELPEFVGKLTNLKNLGLHCNGGTKLPDSLKNLKGLKIGMANATLTLRDQEALQTRFPDATFDFSNEYDDDADDANEVVMDESIENNQ